MSTVLLLVFAITLACAVKFFLRLRSFNKYFEHIPGPKTVPFLGNALDYANPKTLVSTILKNRKEYGSLFKVTIGPQMPRIIISDLKFLEFVMSSTKILKKPSEYNALLAWLGTGLLISTGEKWQKRRKVITPTFHFQILEQFLDVFHSASDIMVEKLQKQVGKEATDLYPYVTLCALDIICETAMGISINAQRNETSEYVKSVKEMGRIAVERATSPLKFIDFFYSLSRDYQKEKKALRVLHDTTDSVIRQRTNFNNNSTNKDQEETEDDIGIKKRVAFLDMLLQAEIDGKKLTDADVREEVDTFMFEGHDTTSSGISFTLMCLGQNPEVQEKAYEEIRSIFEDKKSIPATYQDLQNMKYLELVIKESLRLYPSVPIYGRELTTDIEYEGNIYPKGTALYIFALGLHRCPKIYEDPESFKPERFLQVKKDKEAYSYIPFSAGPRNCIGQKFAMLEMKSTISKVLRHYELLPVEGYSPELAFETILKSRNGMQVTLKQR